MAWLDNANTLVSLIAALVTIGSPMVAFFWGHKASRKQQLLSVEQDGEPAPHKPIISVGWMDFFKWGFVDAANSLSRSILHFAALLDINSQPSERDREQVQGCVSISYGCGLFLLGFFFVITLTFVLLFHNGFTAVLAIMFMMLFVTVSFPYIYHVGKQMGNSQYGDQSSLNQQEVMQ